MNAEYVYRKFPNHAEAIQALIQKDASFREICADYEELNVWLDGYCRSKGRPSIECDHAREVIRDLENEINLVLRAAGY